jgi:REP element-mobilizing transposase RayT
MKYDPEKHHRRSIRLKGYDYAEAGAYFVTVCTNGRACSLGDVEDGFVRLSPAGRTVLKCWRRVPARFPNIQLDIFVVMPNHVHGIVVITCRGEAAADSCEHGSTTSPAAASPLPYAPRGTKPSSLAAIIQAFKASSSRIINNAQGTPGAPVWQRSYYEHIIRSEKSLDAIRQYIERNPTNWPFDTENPLNMRTSR